MNCSYCGNVCSETINCKSRPTATITLVDSANVLAGYHDTIRQNMARAFQDYAALFNSSANIQIEIKIQPTAVGRMSGRSLTNTSIGTFNGRTILEEGAVHKLRTGRDLNGSTADVEIMIDPSYFQTYVWPDPNPATRSTPIPVNKTDLVSLSLHELGHAFGINGFMNIYTGQLPDGWIGSFDRFVQKDRSYWFTGAKAMQTYGGRVPLTTTNSTQNIYHLGDPSTASTDRLHNTLMNGSVFYNQTRYSLSEIEKAIFQDLGLLIGQ